MTAQSADNQSELLEVVDENNAVKGVECRRAVHEKGLLHRAVYCWVFRPGGFVLLQQRAHRYGPMRLLSSAIQV